MEIKKLKKILTIVSLSSLAATCIMLIISIFVKQIYEKPWINFLITFAIFAVSPGIALTEINVLKKKKVIGIVSLSFLGVSTLLALVTVIVPALLTDFGVYAKIMLSITIISILFAIILSNYTKLDKRAKVLQIITYSVLSILSGLILAQIYGAPIFQKISKIMIILIIISVCLLIAITVVSNKKDEIQDDKKDNQNTITIDKKEYEEMKNQLDNLKTENEELKQKLQKYEEK